MAGDEPNTKSTPMRARADALLARYGGEKGPTGHADADPTGAPQSLSSFIGGKAQAPRLGKLAGDGRTSSYDENGETEKFQRLPGMAKSGSMASFMEQRERELHPDIASEKDKQRKRAECEKESPQVQTEEPESLHQGETMRRSTFGKRVVVLISGSGSNFQALLDATCGASPALPNTQIERVISNRMNAYGLQRAKRANPPIPTSVCSLKTYQNRNPGKTRDDYDLVLAERVLGEGDPPDLVVLAGFMHIVSEPFLSAMGHATSLASPPAFARRPNHPIPIINLHPALPGAFDGANAIERAYEAFQAGDIEHTGVMVHEVVAEVDRGAPILVRNVPIYKGESLEDLETRMHANEHEMIVEAAGKVLSGDYVITASGESAPIQANVEADAHPVEGAPGVSIATTKAPTAFLRLNQDGLWSPVAQPLTLYESDVLWVRGPQCFLWLGKSAPAMWKDKLPDEFRGHFNKMPAWPIEHQGRESSTFLKAIGGSLVTMYGSFTDTAVAPKRLFTVRHDEDAMYVEQVPFETKSLCSAFSAVASSPQGVWVWHGVGSDDAQRQHAMDWSRSLDTEHKVVDTEKMLMLMGGGDYANGWHYRRRRNDPLAQHSAKLYAPASVREPTKFCLADIRIDSVSLVDAYLEMYVIIGAHARGDKHAIESALTRAERLAVRHNASQMRPPIHVLVLPSITPLDMLALARDPWNADVFTDGMDTDDDASPLLMNLHALSEAKQQLAQASRPSSTRPANQNYLPVGAPSCMG